MTASPDQAMALMLDGNRVIPCMPGAELDTQVDERTWKAKMTVSLGPVKMHFVADVHVDQIDEEGKRARLVFAGRDTRGMGGAQGSSAAHFVPVEGGRTRVELDTDVQFSGKAAQMGRPNVVSDVSQTLVGRFAHCLQIQLTGSAEEALHAREDSSKPLSGISVMGAAAKGAVGRLLNRDKDDTDNDEGKGDAT
ncbi:MAG: SRPBCC family protein [Thermoleophilia bacterium]|nr:SRPBCC family protein [Thermoleophilia bacterium]